MLAKMLWVPKILPNEYIDTPTQKTSRWMEPQTICLIKLDSVENSYSTWKPHAQAEKSISPTKTLSLMIKLRFNTVNQDFESLFC